MSFTTELFVFLFLPMSVVGYHWSQRYGRSTIWLLCVSVTFYGYSGTSTLIVVLGSAATNYLFSLMLIRLSPERQFPMLLSAITANLILLGYFKYFGFFLTVLPATFRLTVEVPSTPLPLGISFFTFQQIAYLLDIRTKRSVPPRFRDYLLFVTFFPQISSGPINYWYETVPQYERLDQRPLTMLDIAVGLTMFAFGLCKKTVFAGSLGQFVDPVFEHQSVPIGFLEAWTAALAFTLQLYFDFSGYTDMAIGIARLFGVRLPINFNSPFKATSLVDFWRRWHMTMTRFFTDFVYSPLALHCMRFTMLRHDPPLAQFLLSVALPTAVTFLLIGWWHGPQWTYLLFGGINAGGLIINQLWRTCKWSSPPNPLSWLATMAFVIVSVVLFRAQSLQDALSVYRGMLGGNASGLTAVTNEILQGWTSPRSQGLIGVPFISTASRLTHVPELLIYLLGLVLICVRMPNTQEILARYQPALASMDPSSPGWLTWRPNLAWSIAISAILTLGIINIHRVKEFIYIQF